MRPLALAIALALGCGGGSRSPARASDDEATPPAVSNPACDGSADPLSLALHSELPITTPAGLEVTLMRRELDSFADGRYDQWVELRFRKGAAIETRRYSLYATRRPEVVVDVCAMLGERRDDAVELVILPRAARR